MAKSCFRKSSEATEILPDLPWDPYKLYGGCPPRQWAVKELWLFIIQAMTSDVTAERCTHASASAAEKASRLRVIDTSCRRAKVAWLAILRVVLCVSLRWSHERIGDPAVERVWRLDNRRQRYFKRQREWLWLWSKHYVVVVIGDAVINCVIVVIVIVFTSSSCHGCHRHSRC